MNRKSLVLFGLLAASLAVAGGLSLAFSKSGADRSSETEGARVDEIVAAPGESADDVERRRRAAHEAMLDRSYPMHGLVTTAQLIVRASADPESTMIGWLRLGGRVRVKREPRRTPTCATGFYELYPRGFACAGQGIEIGEEPPAAPAAEGAANVGSALPYRYYEVREPQVPEYHRLPSRDEQRAALAHRDRYLAFLNEGQERRAQQLREGGIPNEPGMPTVVARYLERGFFIASNTAEVRAGRRFVRTVRGSYIKEAQLIERTGGEFAGIELDETTTLPIAFMVRAARPMRREVNGGTERFIEEEQPVYERLGRVPWLRRERFGTHTYHVIEGQDGQPRYVREWFATVAERIDPPARIGEDEPWVHVDVSAQTLVVYRGRTPIYATLVSSGLEGHDTPIGQFRIRRKFVSDTMANIGPEVVGDDSYRIEDVPWTQYFEGSVALHGAFWHQRFGLRRSHGCVNLSPRDARYIFDNTWPEVPEGWHGVTTEARSGFPASRVIVTE